MVRKIDPIYKICNDYIDLNNILIIKDITYYNKSYSFKIRFGNELSMTVSSTDSNVINNSYNKLINTWKKYKKH